MRGARNQGRLFAVTAALAWAILAAWTTPLPAAADDAARAALRLQCDEAMESAVRTSFGWGWNTTRLAEGIEAAPSDGKKAPARRAKSPDPLIDAAPTAAIAVQLLWAGDLLNEDKYRQAAREAARGLAAIQNPTGQVRARGLLGKAGGPKEPLIEVPDRGATRAALAVWLALLDAEARVNARPAAEARDGGAAPGPAPAAAPARPSARDERLARPAAAAAHWLARQQTPAGAWAVLYPPDAPRGKGTRLVRLDDPDYRDTALAVLLAGDVLGDAHLNFVFDRSLSALTSLRIATGRDPRPTLWQGAYALDGTPQQKFADLPQGTDLLASRRAMEVLLCAHLIGANEKASPALSEAAEALAVLPKKGDVWSRNYDRRGRAVEAAAQAATRPAGFFEDPGPAAVHIPLGMAPVLAGAEQVRRGNDDALRQSLDRGLSLRQRVGAILCGASGQLSYDQERLDRAELGQTAVESERVRELWLALRKVAATGKS